MRQLGLLAMLALAAPCVARSQASDAAAPLPFAAGEMASYSLSFGALHVGNGSMTLTGADTVRGRPAWHAVFLINGGTLFFRVRDRIESWFDVRTLSSLRFSQSIHEAGYRAERLFEIYPERARYVQRGKEEKPSVSAPLDDASFLYFIRTLPLATIGERHELPRYFQPQGNPVVVRVLRRERVTVPAGTFDAVVVQPQITTKGIFSETGHAEIWIADDPSHVILQMKSSLAFGSINLYLSRYVRGVPVTR
jgi:Protein of unknown function (DUF3108)